MPSDGEESGDEVLGGMVKRADQIAGEMAGERTSEEQPRGADGGRLENDEAVDGEELPQERTLIVSLEDPRCERMAFEEWVEILDGTLGQISEEFVRDCAQKWEQHSSAFKLILTNKEGEKNCSEREEIEIVVLFLVGIGCDRQVVEGCGSRVTLRAAARELSKRAYVGIELDDLKNRGEADAGGAFEVGTKVAQILNRASGGDVHPVISDMEARLQGVLHRRASGLGAEQEEVNCENRPGVNRMGILSESGGIMDGLHAEYTKKLKKIVTISSNSTAVKSEECVRNWEQALEGSAPRR